MSTLSHVGGPFYIACNDDRLYLTAIKDEDYEVETTDDPCIAKKFFILRCSQGDNHFHIVYETPLPPKCWSVSHTKFIDGKPECRPPISRYLCANVNWRGKSKRGKPIKMSPNGQSINSHFAIHSRTSSFHQPADISEWVDGKEVFFINCQERSIKTPTNSYLCAYKSGRVGCKPTVKSHDGNHKFMLFRLLKPAKQSKTEVQTSASTGMICSNHSVWYTCTA